jgi:tRNA modification GTPase
VALIRVSGPKAREIAAALSSPAVLEQAHATVVLRALHDAAGLIDKALVGVFDAPRSYTGENVVEFSVHGSPYIVRRTLEALTAAGARPANPGEFTLRAFLNGKMDLAQAEAVADLIAADNEHAHRLAIAQLRGGISQQLSVLRRRLLDFAALIELELDFSEEDVEFARRDELLAALDQAVEQTRTLTDSFRSGQALRRGIPLVLAGKPNVGKSTLLNALLDDNRAIVSDVPGTTRDVVEDRLFLGGFEFRIMDTAGLRDTADVVEAEGVRRSREKIAEAAVVVFLHDPGEKPDLDSIALAPGATLIPVASRYDLYHGPPPDDSLPLSVHTGLGMDALKQKIVEHARGLLRDGEMLTHARHHAALLKATDALLATRAALANGLSGEIVALELRTALRHIGEITGVVDSDEILGAIFSKFCIGK